MIINPDQLIELAKEFGGGFAAYWTHHVFHKVWHTTEQVRARRILVTRRRAPH